MISLDTVVANLEREVHVNFKDVDKRLRELDNSLHQLHNAAHNANATTRWSIIKPIAIIDRTTDGNVLREPPWFPDRVLKFWDLRKERQRSKLVMLLKFYKVFADEELRSPLNEYINDHMDEALARLAQAVHLNFAAISLDIAIMAREQEQRSQQEQARTERDKRRSQNTTHFREDVKRMKSVGQDQVDSPSLQQRAERDTPDSLGKASKIATLDLLRDPEEALDKYTPSIPSNIQWEEESIVLRSRANVRTRKVDAIPSTEAADLSPTQRLSRSSDSSSRPDPG